MTWKRVWAPIATDDDWTAFETTLEEIAAMRGAYLAAI